MGAKPGSQDALDGRLRSFEGVEEMVTAARTLATAVGFPGQDPFSELAACAQGPAFDRPADFSSALTLRSDLSFRCEPGAFDAMVTAAERSSNGALGNRENVHTSVERLRMGLAVGFVARVAELLAELAERWRVDTGSPWVALGGGFLANVELAGEVRRRLRAGSIAPATDDLSAVLGGSLLGHPDADNVRHLALGPSFDEQQIKNILENCRLEYMYEPDWSRLFDRVSRWITGGRTVGWFQGALDFGRQSLGNRSILADPANRFSRENLNVYSVGPPAVSSAAGLAGAIRRHGWPGRTRGDAGYGARARQPGGSATAHRRSRFSVPLFDARTLAGRLTRACGVARSTSRENGNAGHVEHHARGAARTARRDAA